MIDEKKEVLKILWANTVKKNYNYKNLVCNISLYTKQKKNEHFFDLSLILKKTK